MPRQWSLMQKQDQLIVCDEPIEQQGKKVLIDIIYDLQACIETQSRELKTIKEQQDKFLETIKCLGVNYREGE